MKKLFAAVTVLAVSTALTKTRFVWRRLARSVALRLERRFSYMAMQGGAA